MTQYVVLRQEEITVVDEGEDPAATSTRRVLTIVGEFEAAGDEAACKAGARSLYRTAKGIGGATLVATPRRSFNPASYGIEPEPVVSKLGEVAVAALT